MNKWVHFAQVGYEPHLKQREFHDAKERFKIAICGRRYGKSTMAAKEMEAELMDHRRPGRMFWIVAPTYDLGSREFEVIWRDLMIGKGFLKQKNVRSSYNKKTGSMYIEMPWRSSIEVRSADHPENLVGAGLSGVIMAEAAKLKSDVWEQYIRASLADHRGWAVFTTTPEGQNWMYDLYLRGLDPAEPEYASWQCPSWENDQVYPLGYDDPEVQEMKRALHPVRFAQEIAAEFTSFIGRVYPQFVRDKHVQPHTYREDWPNYLYTDFGYVNPACFLDVQISPRDEVFIWRERFWTDTLLDEIIAEWKSMDHPKGYRIEYATGDAADPAGIMQLSRDLCPAVGEPESKKNWREGVEVVGQFLMDRADGKPGLFVDPSCFRTIKEFLNYRMATTSRKSVNDPMEKPQKRDDHAMDALRYGLMHKYALGMGEHLRPVMPYNSGDGGGSGSDWNYKSDTLDDRRLVGAGAGGYFRLEQSY